jgi:hypothetical protein
MLATSWRGDVDLERMYGAHLLDPTYDFFPKPLPVAHVWHTVSVSYPRPSADGGAEFNWGPVFPLLAEPLHAAFGPAALRIVPLLAGLFVAGLAGAVARRQRRRSRLVLHDDL